MHARDLWLWRIVETNAERVSVEYGSDLDADVYGSGFGLYPRANYDGNDEISDDVMSRRADADGDGDGDGDSDSEDGARRHAWDFSELVNHPSNILRVVGGDIPGLTRPWIYFGMLFSAFCWHVEDHYLGSVNYLHDGAPKTWYSIPPASASAFERAVRTIVPTRVHDTPDLLHRLVTLVPPGVLRDAHGVPVFQTLQKPGTFIVTWPRAYHAGFSHGYNVGEGAIRPRPVRFVSSTLMPTSRSRRGHSAYRLLVTGTRGVAVAIAIGFVS
jgi:[histone H3]-trimethyl-L-lysine4 demethylase